MVYSSGLRREGWPDFCARVAGGLLTTIKHLDAREMLGWPAQPQVVSTQGEAYEGGGGTSHGSVSSPQRPCICPALPSFPASPTHSRHLLIPPFVLQVGGQQLQIKQILNSELAGIGTGGMVWDAAVALCMYLHKRFADTDELKGKRVIEVGSGTGIVGICCAVLGGDVVITDMGPILDLMRHNQQVWHAVGKSWKQSCARAIWFGARMVGVPTAAGVAAVASG